MKAKSSRREIIVIGSPNGTLLSSIGNNVKQKEVQPMIRLAWHRCLRFVFFLFVLTLAAPPASTQQKPLRVLAFYSTGVEQDHVDFAMRAIRLRNVAM